MRSHPLHATFTLGVALTLFVACGGGGTPDTDAYEQCDQGNLSEGFRLIEAEAKDPSMGASDESLGRCLAAAVVAADERGKWTELPDRLDRIQALARDDPGPRFVAAEIEARAALAHARCTERLCCLHDGLSQYDALRVAVADDPAEHVEIVERWYAATRDELLRDGQWVVEIEGNMAYAETVSAVVPSRPEDAYRDLLGKEIVLNNALMMPESKGEAPVRSGEKFGSEISAGLDPARHRKIVVRRPGAADGTAVAALWSDDWDTLLASLHPGTLHTCHGTVAEVERQGVAGGMIVLDRCVVEDARTQALFRQRKCTVCGVRDDREVCRDGYGRSDGQAYVSAAGPLCEELLLFDENPADCTRKVQMTRRCGPNDDPARDPAAGGEQTPPGAAVDPS